MTDKIKCKYCKKSIRKWTVSLDFKRYYHTSHLSDRVICDVCGRSASVQKIDRHKKTLICIRIFNNLTLK